VPPLDARRLPLYNTSHEGPKSERQC